MAMSEAAWVFAGFAAALCCGCWLIRGVLSSLPRVALILAASLFVISTPSHAQHCPDAVSKTEASDYCPSTSQGYLLVDSQGGEHWTWGSWASAEMSYVPSPPPEAEPNPIAAFSFDNNAGGYAVGLHLLGQNCAGPAFADTCGPAGCFRSPSSGSGCVEHQCVAGEFDYGDYEFPSGSSTDVGDEVCFDGCSATIQTAPGLTIYLNGQKADTALLARRSGARCQNFGDAVAMQPHHGFIVVPGTEVDVQGSPSGDPDIVIVCPDGSRNVLSSASAQSFSCATVTPTQDASPDAGPVVVSRGGSDFVVTLTGTSSSSGGSSGGTTGSSSGSGGGTSGGTSGGGSTGSGTFSGPALSGAPTFGDTLTAFQSRVAASPIATSLSGLSDSIPTGGSCPTASFTVLNQQFVMDKHCGLFESIRTPLRAIELIGYACFAIFLFFRA